MSQPVRAPNDRRGLTVLVSAYACRPGSGSELGAGWGLLLGAVAAAERVFVITRSSYAPAVQAELPEEFADRVTVIGLDRPVLRRWAERVPLGEQLYYLAWQRSLRRSAADLHETVRFDLAHHVTFAADWYPIGLSSVHGLPYVLGPVGGTYRMPLPLIRYLGIRGGIGELARSIVLPVLRLVGGNRACRRAALVVAQNDDTAARIRRFASKVVVEPHAHSGAARVGLRSNQGLEERRTILGVGRLVGWKGWALAIDALAILPAEWELVICGEGPDRKRLERRARRRGVAHRFHAPGVQTREELMKRFASATVVVHPSLHDSAPLAVAEALDAGLPVVSLDIAGPGTMVRRAGLQPVDPRGGRLVHRVAQALKDSRRTDAAPPFRIERFPDLIESWYRQALG